MPSQEQTTCSGNSRCSTVYRLACIEWNNRYQPEAPARRKSRVLSVLRFKFFQPIAVLAAARYCGSATTNALLPKPSLPSPREGEQPTKTPSWVLPSRGFHESCGRAQSSLNVLVSARNDGRFFPSIDWCHSHLVVSWSLTAAGSSLPMLRTRTFLGSSVFVAAKPWLVANSNA